jgi:hypothetical protein
MVLAYIWDILVRQRLLGRDKAPQIAGADYIGRHVYYAFVVVSYVPLNNILHHDL